MEKLTRNSIPGILCGIVILILTGLPGSCFPRVKPALGLDKIAHIVMYASFAFLCVWGYREQFITRGKDYRIKALVLATVISVIFGGITEIIQEHWVPLRTGDLYDFIADIIGTLVGISLFRVFFRKKK